MGHHVALSVVGADRMPDSGYMRAKVAQERLIKAGGVPYTIVRATQFFEFLGGIAGPTADGDTVRLPTAPMQPLAADDVAAALADVAVGAPVNGIVELAGPEALPIAEFVGRFLAASGDTRTVVADPQARYFGAALDDRGLSPGSQPAHRPDAVRGLARALRASGIGSQRIAEVMVREDIAQLPGEPGRMGAPHDRRHIRRCLIARRGADRSQRPWVGFVCETLEIVSVFMSSGRGKTNRLRSRCTVESPFTSIFYSRCMKNIAVSFYELLIILRKYL